MLTASGAEHLGRQGEYSAPFNATGAQVDHFMPWSEFTCDWRGEKVDWCPPIATQLGKITSVGVGTFFPGQAGKFRLELSAVSARDSSAAPTVDLATFDAKPSHAWQSENDPVMGGQSSSTFSIHDGVGDYQGTCRIVPKLKAPGFTIALTESPLRFAHFPDVSGMDGMIVDAENLGPVEDFKLAFCDSRLMVFRCQFASFKADFRIPTGKRQQVFLPWAAFSDKWDAATGKHTSENPPKKGSLESITQLQIWVEGVEG